MTTTRKRESFESFVRVSGRVRKTRWWCWYARTQPEHRRDHQNWEINSATYNDDSTYPFPDMSNSQTGATMKWHAELDTAIDLYQAERFEECIAHTNTVFRGNTPLYPRLRYCMLLASCLDDWYEAEEMRFHAENTYTSWCLFNPTSSFPGGG
jgi:hypothetical protein